MYESKECDRLKKSGKMRCRGTGNTDYTND
jgi:hypothetical protein